MPEHHQHSDLVAHGPLLAWAREETRSRTKTVDALAFEHQFLPPRERPSRVSVKHRDEHFVQLRMASAQPTLSAKVCQQIYHLCFGIQCGRIPALGCQAASTRPHLATCTHLS